MGEITLQYPAWFFIFCLVLGAIYAAALYYKDSTFRYASDGSRKLLYGLSVLRFAVVSFIAFLLLAPFLKTTNTEEEKPIIAVLQDDSESIRTEFTSQDSAQYASSLVQLIEDLNENFNVETYSFGSDIEKGIDFKYNAKATNLTKAVEEIQDLYVNQNLGAIVIASDGIYNQGSNPLYSRGGLNVPIYTVALGDTIPKQDLKLAKVYHNRIVYLGDKFNIDIDITANNLSNKNSVLSITKVTGRQNVTQYQKSFSINSNDFETTESAILEATTTGLQRFRIALAPVEGEVTSDNNYQDIFIDVLDARQKVLILAQAPHPDLGAIKLALDNNKNYVTEIGFAQNFSKNLSEYNLVILHQLPSVSHPSINILNIIAEQQIPVWYIVGKQTNIPAFNQAQNVLKINNNRNSFNEVQPVLNNNFTYFKIPDQLDNALPKYPPIIVPYGEFAVSGNSSALLLQKIGAVATNIPLFSFEQSTGARRGVLAGEGIWRWRLHNYMIYKNHEIFDDFIIKSVQFLAVKADKRQFRVNLASNIFNENEPVILDAELYNESYELINTPEVALKIINEEGKEFQYNFNKAGNAYRLNAGFFPVGSYNFTATTTFNGKKHTYYGEFSVSPVLLEAIKTTADHQLLYNLSEQTGGALYFPSQLQQLGQQIKASNTIKPILHESKETQAFINLKWLFFVILLLISVEWFIRKYNGAY